MPTVLFAHDRPGVSRAAEHVLRARGFTVDSVADGHRALERLSRAGFDALVADVALSGVPGFELITPAKALAQRGEGGANVVVLVASVFRKTSYKRRPARLYGADDYVELHHLGDMLPDKLARLLDMTTGATEAFASADAERSATKAVYAEGDTRLQEQDVEGLASLIVADLVLYNGDRIARTRGIQAARAALEDDLDIARDLMRQVCAAQGGPVVPRAMDPIDAAFDKLMGSLGRAEVQS